MLMSNQELGAFLILGAVTMAAYFFVMFCFIQGLTEAANLLGAVLGL